MKFETDIHIREKDEFKGFGIEMYGAEEDVARFESFCWDYFNRSKKDGKDFCEFRQGRGDGWCFFETWAVKKADELKELLNRVREEMGVE